MKLGPLDSVAYLTEVPYALKFIRLDTNSYALFFL